MAEYIIKTDSNAKKTYLVSSLEEKPEVIGLIYTDFLFYKGIRDITQEEIVDPKTKKPIGKVKLYTLDSIISVMPKGILKAELVSFSQEGEYKESGKIIPIRKVASQIVLAKPEYKNLANSGLIEAYGFAKDSLLDEMFCFEKGDDLSAVVHTKKEDLDSALTGLVLALSRRIERQEYLFNLFR
jgi:hypothetical protein